MLWSELRRLLVKRDVPLVESQVVDFWRRCNLRLRAIRVHDEVWIGRGQEFLIRRRSNFEHSAGSWRALDHWTINLKWLRDGISVPWWGDGRLFEVRLHFIQSVFICW